MKKPDLDMPILLTGLGLAVLIGILTDIYKTIQTGSLSVVNTITYVVSSLLLYFVLEPFVQRNDSPKP